MNRPKIEFIAYIYSLYYHFPDVLNLIRHNGGIGIAKIPHFDNGTIGVVKVLMTAVDISLSRLPSFLGPGHGLTHLYLHFDNGTIGVVNVLMTVVDISLSRLPSF